MAKVSAVDFNLVQSKISAVVGAPSNSLINLGYNLSPASSSVGQYDKVYGNHLNRVIQDIDLANIHQTGAATGLTTFQPQKLIRAEDLIDVSSAVDTVYTNRGEAGVGQLTVDISDAYVSGTPWEASHIYRVRFDWGSNSEFRGWANLGGFIFTGTSMTGGSGSNQDASWTNVLAAVGNIVFAGEGSIQQNQTRNGSFPNGGLYNILGIGQSGVNASQGFRILASDINYTGNSFTIYIYPYNGTNGFNCTGFEIEFRLLDTHIETGMGPDLVDSTLGISINTYYAHNKKPTVTSLGSTIG